MNEFANILRFRSNIKKNIVKYLIYFLFKFHYSMIRM